MSCMMVLEKIVYHHSVILTGEWQLGKMVCLPLPYTRAESSLSTARALEVPTAFTSKASSHIASNSSGSLSGEDTFLLGRWSLSNLSP